MLTLAYRKTTKLKCPQHPKRGYGDNGAGINCDCCKRIGEVRRVARELEAAERVAAAWIARTGPRAKAGGAS